MGASTFSGIIESFIKPEALAEFDKLGSKLDASLEGFDKMIAKAALLSTEISKGGQAYSQYIAQTKQIADANNQLQNSQGSITANLKSYNNLLEETADNIKQNTGATDDQARRLIALRTEYSKVKDAVATYQKLIREVGKETPAQLSDKTFTEVFNTFGSDTANSIKEAFNSLDNATKGDFIAKLTADAGAFFEIQKQLEQEIKAVGSAINFQAKEAAAADGSITQLGARLEGLQKAYFGLSEADRNNPVGQNLKKQIEELDPVVKNLEKGIGITRRLVGDYAGQLSPAFQVLNDRLSENGKLLQDNAKFSQLSADAQANLLAETAALEKLMKSNAVAVGDLKSQNIALQKTLIGLEEANLKGSESYKIIQAELVKGTKAVNDLRGEVKALSSDTRALDQVIGVASSLIAVYQTGVGVMQLFGNESEDAQKAIAKLVAVQSVLNGLQTIQAELTKRGTVLNRLYSFTMAQWAIMTDSTAAATLRLRAALVTIGFGAIIIAIGLLITNLDKLKEAFNPAIRSANELEAATRQQYEASLKAIEGFDLEARALKALGFSEDEIKKKKIERTRAAIFAAQIELKAIQLIADETVKAYSKTSFLRNNPNIPGGNLIANLFGASEEEVGKAFTEAGTIKGKIEELGVLLLELESPFTNKKDKPDAGKGNSIADKAKKEVQAALELYKYLKEQQIKQQQDIVANDLNSLEVRLNAREKIASLQKDIIVAEYNFQMKYGELTNSGIELQNKQRADKEQEILTKSLQDQLDIRLGFANKFKSSDAGVDAAFFDANSAEKQIASLTAAYERRRNILQRNTDDELTQLNNARNANIISEDQYNLKRIQIEEATALALLNAELELAEKKMAILKKLGIETIAVETEIARIRKEISEKQRAAAEGTDNQKSGDPIQDQIDKTNELREAWFNLGQTLSDSVFAVLTRGFEQAKNDLQDQIDLIDEKKAKEIEAVNASTASNQDKADRIKIIEATAQANREQLERRQRQIDQERARYQRAAQAVSIIGNTAQGVTAALASVPPNVPLSIIVGAIGALQLATLFATPLPKYLHGKKGDNYEGLATVSEDGRPELYIDPNTGTMGLTPAKPSLMYVSKASTIIPAGQVNDFLKYSGIGHVPQLAGSNSNNTGGSSFTDMNIVNAIKNKKMIMSVNIVNNTGFYDHIKKRIFS